MPGVGMGHNPLWDIVGVELLEGIADFAFFVGSKLEYYPVFFVLDLTLPAINRSDGPGDLGAGNEAFINERVANAFRVVAGWSRAPANGNRLRRIIHASIESNLMAFVNLAAELSNS